MIIFDLDGTLADNRHRRWLVEGLDRTGHKKDYDAFFDACPGDTPIVPVIKLFDTLADTMELQIWSGRSERVRGLTIDWLNTHISGLYGWPSILTRMRPEKDNTPDDKLKERWLNEELAKGTVIDMVFDDRNKVVAMWRRRGIVCAQVAEGNF
jgi:hypothetical protein